MAALCNGEKIIGVLHVAAVVVVFLAEEEIVVVCIGSDAILTTLLEVEEAVGGIGAVGADPGCGLGAGSVVDVCLA